MYMSVCLLVDEACVFNLNLACDVIVKEAVEVQYIIFSYFLPCLPQIRRTEAHYCVRKLDYLRDYEKYQSNKWPPKVVYF